MKVFSMHMRLLNKMVSIALFFAIVLASVVQAETTPADAPDASAVLAQNQIDETIPVALSTEQLKKKVIQLNRDLFILEEDLLFPANTQFSVFLSLDTGKFLQLDSTKLKLNGDIVAAHLYTERQVKSLQRGGMQRLYIGNIKTGEHEVTVFVDGIGPDNRAYKQAASLTFNKDTEIKALEIRIKDQSADFQPSVEIVEWN